MMPEDVHEEKLSFLDFENKLLQTDGPMDKWTNGQTDGPNDGWRDSYRDARMDKKKLSHILQMSPLETFEIFQCLHYMYFVVNCL